MECQRVSFPPRPTGADSFCRIRIKVCKPFVESLWVARNDSAGTRGKWKRARSVGCAVLGGTLQRLEGQRLRKLLHPFKAAFASTDANAQAVLYAGCRLGHPETAPGSVVKSEQRPAKVMDEPPRDDRPDLCCDLRHLQSGDETREIVRVSSNIAHHPRGSAADRVIFPVQYFRHRLRFICLSTLHVFHLY